MFAFLMTRSGTSPLSLHKALIYSQNAGKPISLSFCPINCLTDVALTSCSHNLLVGSGFFSLLMYRHPMSAPCFCVGLTVSSHHIHGLLLTAWLHLPIQLRCVKGGKAACLPSKRRRGIGILLLSGQQFHALRHGGRLGSQVVIPHRWPSAPSPHTCFRTARCYC